MDRLPDDILIFLFRFNIYKFKDFLKLRTVNKKCYEICKLIFDDFDTNDEVFCRRTMFSIKYCNVCDCQENIKMFAVPFDLPPKRVFVYCDKFECSRNVFKTMINEGEKDEKHILVSEAVHRFGKVPRSDGTQSDCMYLNGWMWKDNRVRCLFNNYLKDVLLKDIDSKYRLKYRILKL